MTQVEGLETPAEAWKTTSERSLRILVLPREEIRPLFYFEPSIDEEHSGDPNPEAIEAGARGFRAWMAGVLDRVRRLDQHVPERLRPPLQWLKSRLPTDERLLMALRKVDSVVLVHPHAMSSQEVSEAWTGYLDLRLRRRIFWCAFYALVLVPTVLLTMLPGPNVLGFWVTYRLIAHSLAIASVVRASRRPVEVRSRTSVVLDGPILTDRKLAERIQEHFRMHGLKARLKRERIFARLRKRRRKANAQLMKVRDETER